MNLIERAKEKAKYSRPHKEILERQEQTNTLARQLCEGKISLADFRKALFKLQEKDEGIVLVHPGPLYGLLRKFGFDKETAQQVANEERAHFQVAQKEGLNPRIVLEFSKEKDEKGFTTYYLTPFVAYQIPKEIEEETLRRIMVEIALAPEKPSEDDLVSLPREGVIFPTT